MIEGIENKKYSGLGLELLVPSGRNRNNQLVLRIRIMEKYFYNSLSCFNKKTFTYAKEGICGPVDERILVPMIQIIDELYFSTA